MRTVVLTISETDGATGTSRSWEIAPCQAARLAHVLGEPFSEVLAAHDHLSAMAAAYADGAVVIR